MKANLTSAKGGYRSAATFGLRTKLETFFKTNRRFLFFVIAVALMVVVNILIIQKSYSVSQAEGATDLPLQNIQSHTHAGAKRKLQLTIWTILRELKPATSEEYDQTSWLELLHTYNAVNSWLALDGVQVILFGDDASCKIVNEFVPDARLRCVDIPCIHEEFKVPTYDCLFATAAQLSSTEFIMYSNSDMVYFEDLISAMEKVASEHHDFLMVGQRVDMMYPRKIDFSDSKWSKSFQELVYKYGVQHGKFGVDYFLYRTALSRAVPPFLVGRIRWDNWLLAQYIGSMDAVAVDATNVVLAVHLNHMKVGGSHNRTGTDWNRGLVSQETVDPKKIGDVESTDFILLPDDETQLSRPRAGETHGCPKCHFQKREQSLDVMLFKHSVDQTIIVATVNNGYLDFALNWLCSVQRVGLKNYLFHAVDETIYKTLQSRNLPAVLYESEMSKNFRSEKSIENALVYGSVAYQAVMNSRTEFIYRVLQKGYNVLLCDVDIIFLRNPFQFFDMSIDIQGGAHKQTKITGGFIFFRATAKSRSLWVKVLMQHRDIFKQIQQVSGFNPHEMTEQELVNNLLSSSKQSAISWKTVDEKIVTDGKRFFIDKLTLKNGEWPAVLHNNYIVGHENKLQRFLNISMWLLDSSLNCRAFPRYLPPAPSKNKFSITFKILAFNRTKALQRLLNSLDDSDYQGDSIDLDIFIDAPAEEYATDEAVQASRNAVVKLAEEYEWKHGKKRVIAREQHYGLVKQWLNAWFPQSDSQVALFLEDDNVLARNYYGFLKAALLHYFYNPENYDPRVFGFNMQHQHMIPGRYPQKPVDLLPEGTLYFKYQLLSTWGPVFFPQHWSEFITWYSERQDPSFLPLFSNMITNKWFLTRGGGKAVWSQYFIRFAGERGLYSIYTNFPNEEAFVVNFRDAGQNFKDNKGPNSEAVKEITPEMMAFPPSNKLPLYDFHFNLITEDPSILEDRALYTDPSLDTH